MFVHLKNDVGEFKKKDGFINIYNLFSGETLRISEGNEFVLYLGKKGCFVRCDENDFFSPEITMRKNIASLVYNGKGDFSNYVVTVRYLAEKKTFVKKIFVETLDAKNFDICRLCAFSGTSPDGFTRGGEGQPVFIGNKGWCGTEYPVANNRLENDRIYCMQAPYENTAKFESLPVVFGLNTAERVEQTFSSYVEEKAPKNDGYRIYCDWGLHDDEDSKIFLTEKLTLDNIERMDVLQKKTGFKFDYYLMDAFWFPDGETLEDAPYGRFKRETFPNGIDNVVSALEERGIKFGLWFDINFLKAKIKNAQKYSNCLKNNSLCTCCDETAEITKKSILYHIENHRVKMIKLDFAFFECFNTEHNHSTEFTESKQKSVANYIKTVNEIRAKYPDVKILCYNGWTTRLDWLTWTETHGEYAISPYWVEYADYLYCGDPRPSRYSADGLEKSVCYYTDGMIRYFKKSLVPLTSIDDHGTMLGNTCTIYYLEKKLFRLGWVMNLMRGGKKLHLYGDFSTLDESDLKYLAYVDKMCAKSQKDGYVSKFIGGDPRKREIYGYSISDGFGGYAVMVNPTSNTRTVSFGIPECMGANVSSKVIIRDNEIVKEKASTTFGDCFAEVSAYGFTVIEWTCHAEASAPDCVNLCKGESLSLNAENKTSLKIEFLSNGKPLRTSLGFPDKFTVIADGKALPSQAKGNVWSGLSWLVFSLNGNTNVKLCYDGDTPLTLMYSFTESK
mgnify:CR=1 FL=1